MDKKKSVLSIDDVDALLGGSQNDTKSKGEIAHEKFLEEVESGVYKYTLSAALEFSKASDLEADEVDHLLFLVGSKKS